MKKTAKRRIKVTKKQWIDCGSYNDIYRISPRRIVKVPKHYFIKIAEKMILDEIRGSKIQKFALPILDIVDVELPDGLVIPGILRRYIPNEYSYAKWRKLENQHNLMNSWDARPVNFRYDSKGTPWRVDTQTRNIHMIDNF